MTERSFAAPLTFTLDLERHRSDQPPRYADNAARILDFFTARGVRATVFVVGELIDSIPDLLVRAHAAGHELALHSHAHTPLTEEQPERFATRLRACRARLEDLSGAAVVGFRAPVFSLTPATTWVADVLSEQGFRYSSSVLPARHPLYGFARAPTSPFRWPSGLIELPVPLATCAGLGLPFLGGIYLRYLPPSLAQRWRHRLAAEVVPWSYVHPYDVDTSEGYFRFPGTSAPMSWLLWRRRALTFARLAGLLDASGGLAAPPFAERIAHAALAHAPYFHSALAGAAGQS